MPRVDRPPVTCLIDISEDDQLSVAADLEGFAIIGLIIPTIDSGNLGFWVSDVLGGTYVELKNKSGNAHTVTAGTGDFAVDADDLAALAAYRYIKIKASVVQTSDRTLTFILKE